jgi:hypothetical protein
MGTTGAHWQGWTLTGGRCGVSHASVSAWALLQHDNDLLVNGKVEAGWSPSS